MNDTTTRKKQPEIVKARLLQTAEELTFARGWGNFSLNDVVAESGISKGGLLHHFPTKHMLLAALYDALLLRFDAELTTLVSNDTEPVGGFLRAYLLYLRQNMDSADNCLPAVLRLALVAQPDLQAKWQVWLDDKLSVVDRDAFSLIVRLALDGIWLAQLTHDPALGWRGFQSALEELAAMTRL